MTPRHFLNVQSHHNWMAERADGFLLLGVTERQRSLAAGLSKGDYLITYVTGSGFADVRCVTGQQPVPLADCVLYDDIFPYALETIPVAAIQPGRHISAKQFADRLGIVGKDAPYKRLSQHPLQLVSQENALLLVSLIVATAKVERHMVLPQWSGRVEQRRAACA